MAVNQETTKAESPKQMTTLPEVLRGRLPVQTAVYVVIDVKQKKRHIISKSVNSKYAIVKSQLSHGSQDNAPEVLAYLQQLAKNSQLYRGEDKSGFYNGLTFDSIMEMVCTNTNERRQYARLDLMTPYGRYDIPDSMLRQCIDPSPIIEERMYGPLELVACGVGMKEVAVSVNMQPVLPFVIFKIDQLTCLCEHEFNDGTVLLENVFSSELNDADLDRMRRCAVDIVQLLPNRSQVPERGFFEPIDIEIGMLILSSRNWPIEIHEHKVVD